MKVSAKDIRVAIKKGLTPEIMAEKYGITVEELKNDILRLYNKGNGSMGKELFAELEANRKKKLKVKLNKEAAIVPTEDTSSEEAAEDSSQQIVKVDQTPEDDTESLEAKSMSDLERDELFLSQAVMEYENVHKGLRSERSQIKGRLQGLYDELEIILRRLPALEEEYNTSASEADEIGQRMNEISTARAPKKARLEVIREEIANRNTVVFCVGSDGTIEAPDKPEFPIDDSGYLELKNTLIERDECQDLRIRDITTLARLIKIVAKAERFTLICDSAELEAAFWALIENRQSGH